MMSKATAAEQYARMGFPVFPLEDDGKRPRIKAWQKNATTDVEQVRAWWTKWPEANIATTTGSGFFVLDEDNKNGKDGKATRLDLEAAYSAVPKQAVVTTPSGGAHYWMKAPAPINSTDDALGSGLDTKGEGGYVILPPSTTPEGKYGFATKFNREIIPAAPRWIVERARKREPVATNGHATNGALVANDGIESVIVSRAIDRVQSGEARNATGFNYLALQLRDNGVPIGTAMAAGHQYADAVTNMRDHPYERDEIEKSIEQAYRNGHAREPWSLAANGGRRCGQSATGSGVEGAKTIFQNTDLGNAERLAYEYGDDLLYCHVWGSWLAYTGARYETDATGYVDRCAYELVRTMQEEAVSIKDDDARSSAMKHARASQSASKLRNMVSILENLVPVVPDDLDADNYLFNAANCTIDLRTGEPRPHRQTDLITKLAPVKYDAMATCPRWEQHLREVFDGDEEIIEYLHRNIGYSMTGDVSEQIITILYGSGANGKGVTTNTVMHVLGDYAQSTRPELLLHKPVSNGPSPGEAALKGARFVSTSESGSGQKFDEATVKRLTGGDRIRARFNRQDEFEFDPTHKLWFATNHKPKIEGTDYAIWRRIHLIPFTVTFTEEKRDKDLEKKLRAEASGILNWMIQGCLKWQRDGLKPPEAVQEATNEYKSEMDVLAGFLDERCETEIAQMEVKASRLYQEYRKWCEQTGEFAETQTNFGLRLAERGFDKNRKSDGNWYRGIGIRG